jgi:chromosome segregation ATPase
MLKKMLVGSLAATLVAGFVFGKDMFSYATTACTNVRDAVKSEITPEFELDRIRNEIDQLMPEIRQHMTVVAEQSVDVKDLERGIEQKETHLAGQKDAIFALRADLTGSGDKFTYRHVSYTRGEVESDLSERFEAFRVGEDAVKRDRQILTAQRQTLRANQQKLDSMLGRKQELSVLVSQVEARLKTIQAAEAVNNIEVDDTKLARVEGLIKDLNHVLDVRESLLETEGHVLGRIPVELDSVDVQTDVVTEIDQHFGLVSDAAVAEVDSNSSI